MARTKKTNLDKLRRTLILKEPEDREQYAIENSELEITSNYIFNSDNEELSQEVSGILSSDYFINNTELDYIKSWRFEVYNVKIAGFVADATNNIIKYKFTAKRLEITDEVNTDE